MSPLRDPATETKHLSLAAAADVVLRTLAERLARETAPPAPR